METIGFISADGRKHIGYRLSSASIGEPWMFGPSVHGYYYFDEDPNYDHPFDDVKEVFPITIVDFYYWDAEKNNYQILTGPSKTTLAERSSGLFKEDLITNDKPTRLAYFRMIREWLILNTVCSAPIYIDKEYTIRSEGSIIINPDSIKQIPKFIRISNAVPMSELE